MIKCIYCGLCEDVLIEMQLLRTKLNFQLKKEELFMRKLLENGDRWESVLAENIKLDKPYR